MPHPTYPKHLVGVVARTGYGYVSKDNMYRFFRYKWTHSYHVHEPERWMMLKPDGEMEYFEELIPALQRMYDLQETSKVKEIERKEQEELKKQRRKKKQKR